MAPAGGLRTASPLEVALTERPRAHVLVVDNEPEILEVLQTLLVDEGYAVSTARDGAEALERVREAAPDLILLDMLMPGMDGWGFAREYGRLPGPRAPIVVTAATYAEERAQQIGAAAHCAKPFELDALLTLIRQVARADRRA